MQMPMAVESMGDSKDQSQSQLAVSESTPLSTAALSVLQLSNPGQDAKELSEVLSEDNTICYDQEKLSVNIAILVCPCFCLSLTHYRTLRIKCESCILIKRVIIILHPCTSLIMAIQQLLLISNT